MIYIHKLRDLNPKAAEIESVALVRDFKKQLQFPLETEKVQDLLEEFFPSETKINAVKQALERIQPSIKLLEEILVNKQNHYEFFNVQRSIKILKEIQKPLSESLMFMTQLQSLQKDWINNAAATINAIPEGDKNKLNQDLNTLFEQILRSKDFEFNSIGIIGESTLETATTIQEGMKKYFLIKITLEEQIKKVPINEILRRIPLVEVQKNDELGVNVEVIKKGVDQAYTSNMLLIELAIMLYSLVRWVQLRIL